jgi:hypothetical protein
MRRREILGWVDGEVQGWYWVEPCQSRKIRAGLREIRGEDYGRGSWWARKGDGESIAIGERVSWMMGECVVDRGVTAGLVWATPVPKNQGWVPRMRGER